MMKITWGKEMRLVSIVRRDVKPKNMTCSVHIVVREKILRFLYRFIYLNL